MFYYKVVYIDCGKMVSICRNRSILSSFDRVEYIKDVWVKPKIENSYLFAFKTLEAAEFFIKEQRIKRCEIWKCKAKHTKTPPRYLGTDDIQSYWNVIATLNKKKKKLDRWNLFHFMNSYIIGSRTPDETILAKEIKLIERVK